VTKAIIVLRKRPDIEWDQFRNYWLSEHAGITSRMPGLRRYTQDHMPKEPRQEDRPCDGIEELEFDSPEALQTALASEEGVAAIDDLSNFADVSSSGLMVVEEVPVEPAEVLER
jgi:uncharacterized protein (TIGR02118 family)